MALANEARREATKRVLDQQKDIVNSVVTQPAVSDPVPRDTQRIDYLGVRNNDSEIGALVQQYGIKRTIAMLKDQEKKLQHDQQNGRYD